MCLAARRLLGVREVRAPPIDQPAALDHNRQSQVTEESDGRPEERRHVSSNLRAQELVGCFRAIDQVLTDKALRRRPQGLPVEGLQLTLESPKGTERIMEG